ncbi:ABC-type transport auxiliary lipoprotein family protein [Rhodoferax sp.]|uniref:ABC-type transport auxiliary lipoprotein family protein n=1 Tax=Rhodoferax sp. TaxID=50421 RepID=UPI0019FEE11A|nr:ABC-type transport auxiliary lipoprotein family protein [Rhodoferax sp.]MBE0475275.1 membrane integrity-associated transporter subunit PqiC [Rhodoferax sp.]
MKKSVVQMTRGLWLALALWLAGCASPRSAETHKVYDFGPAPLPVSVAAALAHMAPLVLFDTQAPPSLDADAVLYRLAYADAQQLKPYALARWRMPPAQLISQRLRQHLALQRAVVAPGELLPASAPRFAASAAAAPVSAPSPSLAAPLLNLRLVLEEFSQVFDSPADSHGLLRLRATLTQRASGSEILLAQRSFVVQQPAPSPDAVGAVRALTAASDQLAEQMAAWLAPL